MKKYINRLIIAAASILLGAGTATAQDALTIEGSVKNATVTVYKADAKPTEAPSGATATTIAPGEWIILKVTPKSGYWIYDDIITIQRAGSIGGAESRGTGAIIVPKHPTALSGNKTDGTGCYYLQIPAEWKKADGYIKVIIGGEAIPKVDISSATLSGTTLTATTGDWTVYITFDALSFTYTGSVQGPEIESFSLTNGGKSYFIYGKHVSISGSGIEAGTYTATLTSQEHGCLKGTKTVDFEITQEAGSIYYNTTSVTKTYGDDAFTNSLSKFGDGTVKYSISPATGIATIDETTGEVTITGCGDATITATVTDGKNYTYATKTATYTLKVNKKPTEITVAPANPEWGDTWQLKVWDEVGIGATLTPAEAGSLSYSSSDESVVKIEGGKIKAVGAGTATITVSFAENDKYLAATSKTINVHVTKDLDESNITLTTPTGGYTYDGTEKKPTVTVKDGDKTLTIGTHYNVSYSNNVNAGENTATVTVTDIPGGDYNVSGTKTFSIAKRPVTLTSGSKTRDYNESALTNDEVEGKNANGLTVETGWVTGQGASYTFTGTQTTVGSTPNAFTYTLNSGTIASNYDITKTEGTLTVGTKSISGATVTTDPTTYVYDGTEKKPTVTVVLGGKTLVKGTDYDDVTYTNNTGAGTATVTVTGKGNYSGTTTGTFTITPATGDLTFQDITKTYGDAPFEVNPSSVVSPGSITYTSGNTDVVTVSGNTLTIVGAGEATITATQAASGSYAAQTKTFKVTVSPNGINANGTGTGSGINGQIVLGGVPEGGFTYDGQPHKPTVTVKDGNGNVIPADQYDVSYKDSKGNAVTNPTDADTYTVVITDKTGTGFDNYTVSGETTFSIAKRPVTITAENKDITFGDEPPTYTFAYSGFVNGESADVLTTKPTATCSYTVGSNVGTYPISASGAAAKNYQFNYVPGTLTVGTKSISGATVTTDPTTYVYDGTEKKPTVTVVLGGKTLVKGTDYDDVTYTNNTGAGTATVTATGKGNYSGTTTGTFTITPATGDLTFLDITKTYGDAPFEVNPSSVVSPGAITYTSGNTDVVTVSGNTLTIVGAGEAVITATQVASGSYAAQTKTFKVTVSPNGINANGTGTGSGINGQIVLGGVPEGGFTYDGQPHKPTVTVKDGNGNVIPADQYSVSYKDSKGNAVTNPTDADTYTVVITDKTGTGYDNYEVNGTTTFKINEKALKDEPGDGESQITIVLSQTEYAFDGNEKTPAVTVKDGKTEISDNEYTVSYANNVKVGTATVTITDKVGGNFTVSGKKTFVIYRTLDGLFINGNEWATFVAEEDLAVPDGLEAYVVTRVSGTTMNIEAAAYVPKGVGILLKRTDKTVNSYKCYAYAGEAAPPVSLLKGSATAATSIKAYEDYVLYNDQFELAGVSSVAKGHAYLPKAAISVATGSRSLSISVGGNDTDVTGIGAVSSDNEDAEEKWYDLNGRRLSGKPIKKGLYIKDGRKVVIK